MTSTPAAFLRRLCLRRIAAFAIMAALSICGMEKSTQAQGTKPCYMLSPDSPDRAFICLSNPDLIIITPRGYFDIFPGTASEIAVQISDSLWSRLVNYGAGKQAGIRDDKQAVIDLVKGAKKLQQKRKLLADPTVRQYCATSGLSAGLFPPNLYWFPPEPRTVVTYAFADDPAHPEQRITDPDVRAAILDGLNVMSKTIKEKLPTNTPPLSPLPVGSHDVPSITIRLGNSSDFRNEKQQMRVSSLTKSVNGAWKTGEILVNPESSIYKNKDFQGLSIAATHEGGHVYGMEHAESGVMEDSTSAAFDFFNFHREITCMVAPLYTYYDYLLTHPP